jgi:hypothetical protein
MLRSGDSTENQRLVRMNALVMAEVKWVEQWIGDLHHYLGHRMLSASAPTAAGSDRRACQSKDPSAQRN